MNAFRKIAALMLIMGLVIASGAMQVGANGQAGTTLSATVDVTPHWTITYGWTIDKSVTPGTWNLHCGESGTSTYTITVTKDGGTEEAWVEGQVCVTNGGERATENLKIVVKLSRRVSPEWVLIGTVDVDVSSNAVLDPGETGCYSYRIDIPSAHIQAGGTYKVDSEVTITNHSGHLDLPFGPSPDATTIFPLSPTLVNDMIHVDDNGRSWEFSASGSVSYTKTFACPGDAGEHTNTATIRETGQSDSATVTVNCEPCGGCTLTVGYWKTHSKYGPAPYDDTWVLLGEDTPFFKSGQSYYQVLWTVPSGGNAYYILAHQYIAAKLNILSGAASTPAVDGALAWAKTFFSTYKPSDSLPKSVRNLATYYANLLDQYNNGYIGPGHCSE